jgi:hypothetical protein
MRIDRTEFGSITVDGETYDHDIVIGLSGAVTKRKKRLSKAQFGTSHIISKAEAKSVYEKGCAVVIIGAGQDGNVRLSLRQETISENMAAKSCWNPRRGRSQPSTGRVRTRLASCM